MSVGVAVGVTVGGGVSVGVAVDDGVALGADIGVGLVTGVQAESIRLTSQATNNARFVFASSYGGRCHPMPLILAAAADGYWLFP